MRSFLIALTLTSSFITLGAIGSALGMWMALPSECFTVDNLHKWTQECKDAKSMMRNARRNQS